MNKEAFYQSVLNNLQDGVYFVDPNRVIRFWNAAAENITGYSAEEIVGKDCPNSGLNHIDETGTPLCTVGCPLFATLIDGQTRKHRVFLRHKKGHRIPVIVNIFPMYSEGEIIGAVEVFTPNSPVVYDDDIIESLTDKAMHDELTKLPNRAYLESYMSYKLAEYNRFGRKFAVLFCDIDNFRTFNNTYGHDIGDLVLKNISSTIKSETRKGDLFGRWGGEEFIGIYEINRAYESTIIAEKLRYLVENTQIVTPDKQTLSVTISVGITVVKKNDSIDDLVKRADELMYKSKEAGKNRITSDPNMEDDF